MKIKAIISCFSKHSENKDLFRLEKTLEHFCRHNPDIPVTVINDGGESPIDIVRKFKNCYLSNEKENSYIRDGGFCRDGTFGYLWFKRLFDFGLKDDGYSHVLFLETDVLTRSRVACIPKYDMAGYGMVSWWVANEFYCDHFKMKKTKHIKYSTPWDREENKISFLHYGTGGTIFRKEFFKKAERSLNIIERLYEENKSQFLQDLAITSLAHISDCTTGEWEDVGVDEESISWLKNREEILRASTGKEALIHQHEFEKE
jgi:hypothetical protein